MPYNIIEAGQARPSRGTRPQMDTTFAPTPENGRDLRRAFGRFGTGVTIITAHTPDGPLGMTANSFTSVSLDPALVLWSVAISSKRHNSFAQAPQYAIHILAAQQQDLAQRFASDGFAFDGIEWTSGAGGVPILGGALAVFECAAHAVHPAGDHSIIVGQVENVHLSNTDDAGLLFERGQFGTFAPEA